MELAGGGTLLVGQNSQAFRQQVAPPIRVLVPYHLANTIINTSCEHLSPDQFQDWRGLLPQNKLLVLQSNDFTDIEDHVGCVTSAEELRARTGIDDILYVGKMKLYKYTRFMVIGRT